MSISLNNTRIMKKYLPLIFIIFLLIPTAGFAQNNVDAESSNNNLRKAAREIMTSSETCALITLDGEGRPRVRVMDPFLPENDFTVWFGTNSKSRKVAQIKMDPRVTLYYLKEDQSGYVMLHGIAELVNDPEEKEKRWKEEWVDFYPNKADDYLLIKVSPKWLEVISYGYGIQGDPVTWEPPRITFDSK